MIQFSLLTLHKLVQLMTMNCLFALGVVVLNLVELVRPDGLDSGCQQTILFSRVIVSLCLPRFVGSRRCSCSASNPGPGWGVVACPHCSSSFLLNVTNNP